MTKGLLDYWLKPGLRTGEVLYDLSWRGSGPMNGQPSKRLVVEQIFDRIGPTQIVETGTNRGLTTAYLAGFPVRVHTIELDERLYGYSTMRLRHLHNVTLHLGRSVEVLRELKTEPRVLFYLDAHGDAGNMWDSVEVPLHEELVEIFSRWPSPVVLVDDFQVPGDSYSYLDRGPGRRLTPEILGEFEGLSRWYPSAPAYTEPGMNTGWMVMGSDHSAVLDGIHGLRRG